MKNSKILYIMHVPWGWIKQRPHFFAEHLNKDFDVNVVYKKPLKVSSRNLINKKDEAMAISSFFVLPFQRISFLRNIGFLKGINSFLVKMQLPRIFEYDYVWVTSWSMYSLISPFLPSNVKLIYDCMDDELEFESVKNNPVIFKEALFFEKEVLQRASVVFCSSEYLKNKIVKRTGIDKEIIVLNNAIGIPDNSKGLKIKNEEVLNSVKAINNSFMYVGAISAWFDFELILNVLKKNASVSFILIGPCDVQIPEHDRLHYLGTVDRDDIFQLMENVEGLIMPFKLNELIRSVNPVKIYEYIYMSKPIIATRYSESELFEDYVYLYSDKEEFYNFIVGILDKKLSVKKSAVENKEFALLNTWEVRYDSVKQILK